MSKDPKNNNTSRASISSRQSPLDQKPALLSKTGRTRSASTSVGLSLAGLPSTPSPIIIGPGREETVGYFNMQRRVSNSSAAAGQATKAQALGATASGQFVTRQHRSSSSSTKSSSLGASDLLAALHDGSDGSDVASAPTDSGGVTPHTPAVRFTDSAVDLGRSVDTPTSRGSVSSFADDGSSSHASTATPRSSTPDSGRKLSQNAPLPKATSRLRPTSVKRTQSGHGLMFVPAPAAPSVASDTSSKPSSELVSRRRAVIPRGEPSSILRNPKGKGASTSSLSSVGSNAPRHVAKGEVADRGAISQPSGAEKQTRFSSDDVAIDTSSRSTSSAMGSTIDIGEEYIAYADRGGAARAESPSTPLKSSNRNSGKFGTPTSPIDGDVFYTPIRDRPASVGTSSSSTRTFVHQQKRVQKTWVPIGATDSDDDVKLNDVEENEFVKATWSSLSSPSLTKPGELESQHVEVASTNGVPAAYVPPYEVRKKNRAGSGSNALTVASVSEGNKALTVATVTQTVKSNRFAVTLVASLGRHTADTMPFGHRRMELDLVWEPVPATSLWSLIPGSSYVPAWRLRPAGKASGYEEVGFVRRTVGRIPIVGGVAAAWL